MAGGKSKEKRDKKLIMMRDDMELIPSSWQVGSRKRKLRKN